MLVGARMQRQCCEVITNNDRHHSLLGAILQSTHLGIITRKFMLLILYAIKILMFFFYLYILFIYKVQFEPPFFCFWYKLSVYGGHDFKNILIRKRC